jgi:hypothetical protein
MAVQHRIALGAGRHGNQEMGDAVEGARRQRRAAVESEGAIAAGAAGAGDGPALSGEAPRQGLAGES